MSSTTQDPNKYFRAGIAITLDRKEEFDRRLTELGLKGVGELALFFILQDGIVDALKPLAEQYHAAGGKKGAAGKVKEAAEKLKGLSSEELDRLIAMAKTQ